MIGPIPKNGGFAFASTSGTLTLNIPDAINISDGGTVKLGFKPNDVIKIIGKNITGYIHSISYGVDNFNKVSFNIQADDEGVVFLSSPVDIDGNQYIIGIRSEYEDNSDIWAISCEAVV